MRAVVVVVGPIYRAIGRSLSHHLSFRRQRPNRSSVVFCRWQRSGRHGRLQWVLPTRPCREYSIVHTANLRFEWRRRHVAVRARYLVAHRFHRHPVFLAFVYGGRRRRFLPRSGLRHRCGSPPRCVARKRMPDHRGCAMPRLAHADLRCLSARQARCCRSTRAGLGRHA